MKKSIATISAAVLLAGAFAVGNTVAAAPAVKSGIMRTVDEKVKIKPEELPEAVRTKLSGDAYKGWEVSTAYMYKESKTYEVELKKSGETKTVKFDKDGKEVI